jgi:predicted transcriptional regulator
MGLADNYHSGLTPLEISKQSYLQPSAIGGRSLRVKTFSTTLNRLEAKHLARRVREGRPFRYFLTPNGLDYLAYQREERKKMKQRIYADWGLSLQHLLDRRKVIETEKLMLQYQMGVRRKVRGFDVSAVDVMKWCLDLAKTILVLKHALINAGSQKLRSEAIAQGEKCLAQLADRQRAELYIALIERFSS